MDALSAIYQRKSSRVFQKRAVDIETQREIIGAALQAPSPKNCQPWRFQVITDRLQKEHIANILDQKLHELRTANGNKNIDRPDLELALQTVDIIRSAPMLVFVYLQTDSLNIHDDGVRWELHARDSESTYIMAIGAAIQNMLLAATEKGLGSLWIADIFYAYNEILEMLQGTGVLISAVAIGYSDDSSRKKARISLDNVMI